MALSAIVLSRQPGFGMRIFKTKAFRKWADNEGLDDKSLAAAVDEMEQGLVDARLGGQVYKKRVALAGRGKRGGARTLLAFKSAERAFYLYGFAKNRRANVSEMELKALKLLAAEMLGYQEKDLQLTLNAAELIEIEVNDDE
jgi:hypothetical protein